MRVKSKETSWCQKLKRGGKARSKERPLCKTRKQIGVKSSRRAGKHEANRKTFMHNIEIKSQKQLKHPPTSKSHLHGEHPHPKHLAKRKKKMT
jgi:hypothetical protein